MRKCNFFTTSSALGLMALCLSPVFVAYAVDPNLTVQTLLQRIGVELINPIIVFLFILATLIFVWGIVLYVIGSQGDGNKLKTARDILLWGLVGMFIMSSAWGIVNLFCNFFDTCSGQIPIGSPPGGANNGIVPQAPPSNPQQPAPPPSNPATQPAPPPPPPPINGPGL